MWHDVNYFSYLVTAMGIWLRHFPGFPGKPQVQIPPTARCVLCRNLAFHLIFLSTASDLLKRAQRRAACHVTSFCWWDGWRCLAPLQGVLQWVKQSQILLSESQVTWAGSEIPEVSCTGRVVCQSHTHGFSLITGQRHLIGLTFQKC